MNIDRNQLQRQRIWSLIDSIEDRLGIVAHDIPDLKDRLKAYQDGILKPIYFINYLSKYIDQLEE